MYFCSFPLLEEIRVALMTQQSLIPHQPVSLLLCPFVRFALFPFLTFIGDWEVTSTRVSSSLSLCASRLS